MKTRAQTDSRLAYDQISQLRERVDDEKQKTYGSLCHQFPMLVLRSGLCQAVAFYTVKATDSASQDTYRIFLEHMARAAGETDNSHEVFQKRITEMELSEYRQTTRRILAAAIWYKRFAISLLDVENAGDNP